MKKTLRRVIKAEPNLDGLLREQPYQAKQSDAYATDLLPGDSISPVEWAHSIFTIESMPWLVRKLMSLRDKLVRPFGLKTTDAIESPPYTGFPIILESSEEIILGLDDKHLSFRVSIWIKNDRVIITTIVKTHNWLGRCYWAIVRILHPYIVRACLKKVSTLN